ncbi:hypothetical protein [Novacetimonas hansenii]|uniref:hypothetical protein n=1 Tax=Novacetimonas hansenii TaxID=436 RepID=UPI000A464DDD|nr:hypothetical protein [Novacetimonas hansenii]
MPDAVTPVMAADATWRADPCVAPCVVHVFVALLFMVLWFCVAGGWLRCDGGHGGGGNQCSGAGFSHQVTGSEPFGKSVSSRFSRCRAAARARTCAPRPTPYAVGPIP